MKSVHRESSNGNVLETLLPDAEVIQVFQKRIGKIKDAIDVVIFPNNTLIYYLEING